MNSSSPFDEYSDVAIIGLDDEKAKFRRALGDSYLSENVRPITWYGPPGFGKSTLRQMLDELLQSARLGNETELNNQVAYASLQVKDGQPVTDKLISIRTQLAHSGGFRFFLFDWAFIRWFRLSHPDASIEQRHPNMFSAGGRGAADDILSWLNEIGKDKLGGAVAEQAGEFVHDSITLVPGLNLLVKYGYKLGVTVKAQWHKKAYRDQIALLDRLSEEELLERLAGLLAADLQAGLNDVRCKHGAASVTILIDGAEKLLTAHDHRGALDGWVLDFRKYAPSVFLNLFSRNEEPCPGLDATTVRLYGFDDEDLRRLAAPLNIPDECLEVICRFAFGVPLSARIALSLYRDHETALASSDEESAAALEHILMTQGHARVLSHVARDLSGDTVRDMVFLSGLEHVYDARVREYGDLVFGSGANVNMDSIINHGLMESIPLENGVYRKVPMYLQEAFLRSPRHERLNTDLQQRLTLACFDLVLRRAAEEGEIDGLLQSDMDRAVTFWQYRWSQVTFDEWERTMLVLLEAGHVQKVWEWASRLLSRASRETPGFVRLDDTDTEGKLRLCARAGSVVARAAAQFGDHAEALANYRLVIDAQRRLGQVDFSTCLQASQLAIANGDNETFEGAISFALEAVLANVDRAIAILDQDCISSAAGAETYRQLLCMICEDDDVTALQAARELALAPRWLQCHTVLHAMHIRVEELLCISEPNYRHLRELHSALSEARCIFRQRARDLAQLAPWFLAYETISEVSRQLVILSSRSLQLEVDAEEHHAVVGPYAAIAEGWPTLGDALQDKAVSKAAYALLEHCGEDLTAFGRQLLRVLQIEADQGNFAKIAALCQGYEEELTRRDDGSAPGASDLILVRIYGYFAVALYRLGADARMVDGKLVFALRAMIDLTDEVFPPPSTRDSLWRWFREAVCQLIGFEPYIRKNDDGPGYLYGLQPVEEAKYH